jgi:murein DD-endopeptidase MepM/ murein hydrolase activator NlpD
MCASLRWAIWPQVVAISLIGLGAASCSDTERFSSFMDPAGTARSNDAGSSPQGAPVPGANSDRIDVKPMPPVATTAGEGNPEITGSVRSAAPPAPAASADWTWQGATPIIVGQGETLDMLSRRYAVPADAILQANKITSGAAIHAGQHLVIPRRRSSAMATSQRDEPRHLAGRADPPSSNEKRPARSAGGDSTVHIVAPGETLNSIARRYGKPVMVLARASDIPPDTMVRVGQRIVIPDGRRSTRAEAKRAEAKHAETKHAETKHAETKHAETKRPKAPAANKVAKREATHREVASADPPHSAFNASTVAPKVQQAPAKVAEPAGALPSFRWPVRGRVITGFGPKPSGVQNDGIDLAVPQGTPVKAADDGVVAYAGNELKGYGNLVLIRHGNGYVTAYAHASEILVRRGETVKRGQVIAKSGETGSVKSPELHFEIRKGATPVDPAQFLNGA